MEGVASPSSERTSLSGSETFDNDQLRNELINDTTVQKLTNNMNQLNINEKIKKEKKSKRPRKNRCHMCSKKLGLLPFECKCGGSFCPTHRYIEEHQCTFDWKQEGLDRLKQDNPQVVADKIIRI